MNQKLKNYIKLSSGLEFSGQPFSLNEKASNNKLKKLMKENFQKKYECKNFGELENIIGINFDDIVKKTNKTAYQKVKRL